MLLCINSGIGMVAVICCVVMCTSFNDITRIPAYAGKTVYETRE